MPEASKSESGSMVIRMAKSILVMSAALFATLVAFNNITDYGSNFTFVRHVLSMDTTFPGNAGMWRSMTSNAAAHAAYIIIIILEIIIAGLCWLGGLQLWKARHDARLFSEAKSNAIIGLTLGIFLWFTGFIVVGGEWFLSWQSEDWNGLTESARFTIIFTLFLIYLTLPESLPSDLE